jgi:hypothetical protein
MVLSKRRPLVPDAVKQTGCAVPTMVLSEAFRLSLFLVVRGGIGFLERLGAQGTRSLTALWILTLEPERLENQPAIARNESWDGLSTDAQAACCFRYSASKPTPFFQTIKVMAAILRARVRRAIVGFIPLATRAAWNCWNGPGTAAARVAAPLKIFFRSWL